jgi:hypothetical protein
MGQGDTPYLIRTYALRSQDQDEQRSVVVVAVPFQPAQLPHIAAGGDGIDVGVALHAMASRVSAP